MSTTEVVNVAQNTGLRAQVASLNDGEVSVFSSIVGDDFASKKAVVQALTASKPIRDHLGTVIPLTHVVVQVVQMENEQTKQIEDTPRVVLIDSDGNSYHAISGVILNDIQNIMGIVGAPATWPEPIDVVVSEERANSGRRFMTLTLV